MYSIESEESGCSVDTAAFVCSRSLEESWCLAESGRLAVIISKDVRLVYDALKSVSVFLIICSWMKLVSDVWKKEIRWLSWVWLMANLPGQSEKVAC